MLEPDKIIWVMTKDHDDGRHSEIIFHDEPTADDYLLDLLEGWTISEYHLVTTRKGEG